MTVAPWKKSYDQPRQHIKKQRDIILLTKVRLVKAMVFPVVMYGCESCDGCDPYIMCGCMDVKES